jgi:hypothetical protein
MYLMAYTNENGDKVYTLKVSNLGYVKFDFSPFGFRF